MTSSTLIVRRARARLVGAAIPCFAIACGGAPSTTVPSSPPAVEAGAGIHAVDFARERFESHCGHRAPAVDTGTHADWTLALEHIAFGDLTGDGVDEAAVVLSCTTGGSAGPQPEVHVFTMRRDTLARIARLPGGNKLLGPEDVAIENARLRIVRYFQIGNAMPLEEEVETFRWNGAALVRANLVGRHVAIDVGDPP